MMWRKIFLYVHLVLGLIAAIVLISLGVTGGLIAFESEINYALNAKLYQVTPVGQRLTLNALSEKLEQAYPGTKVASFNFPMADDLATTVSLRAAGPGKNLSVTVNPYTGAVLGSPGDANPLMQRVHQFHTRLALGDGGKWIPGWDKFFGEKDRGKFVTSLGAGFLIVLAITGIILWWPQKMTKFTPSASGSRRNLEIHNVLGIYASVFMLLFGVTGLVIHWDEDATKIVNRLAGAPETITIPKPNPAPKGATLLNPDQIIGIALNAAPGARVTAILNYGNLRNVVRVTMRYPEDRTPLGRTNLFIDPATGEVLLAQTSRTGPAGVRVVKLWNREIHTGDIFGWPTRVIAFLASWSLPLLAITGPLIWWGKQRRKGKPATGA